MGVRRSDFVVVGANIGKEHYNDEQFEEVFAEFSDNKNIGEITYLIDGYSGKYFIVGQVLAADSEGFNGISLDFSTISDDELTQIKQKVSEHIKNKFGKEINPSVIVKTHWT